MGLNLLHNFGEAAIQTIKYEDTSEIYFVVNGEQAQAAYEQALPILKGQAPELLTLYELTLLEGLLLEYQTTSAREAEGEIENLIDKLNKLGHRSQARSRMTDEYFIRTYVTAARAASPHGRAMILKLARRAMTEAEYTALLMVLAETDEQDQAKR
jgi:hypothetical protein